MERQGEFCAFWREIADALARGEVPQGGPGRFLLDAVQRLALLADASSVTPEQAAKLVPQALGMTGRDIRAHRDAARQQWIDHLLELERQQPGVITDERKLDHAAATIGEMVGRSTRTIWRRDKKKLSH